MMMYDFICSTLCITLSITRTTNTLIFKGQCMAAMDLSKMGHCQIGAEYQ